MTHGLFVVLGIMYLAVYYGPLLYTIPPVPKFDPQPLVGIDVDYFAGTDKGIFLGSGNDSMGFYFDWYGMQSVGIIVTGNTECAVHIQWTNGKETCIIGPEE